MLTLAEFREYTKDMPDNTLIILDEGDCESWEMWTRHRMPATDTQNPMVVLCPGQQWSHELDYHARLDHHLEYGDD